MPQSLDFSKLGFDVSLWQNLPQEPITKIGILLHGYGANKDDLIGLAEQLTPSGESWLWLSPDAPQDIPGNWFGGKQWFPLTTLSPQELQVGAQAAKQGLIDFVYQALDMVALTEKDLIIAGFSQGSMMALEAGLNLKAAPAAIVGFSGAYVSNGRSSLAQADRKPPILLLHGNMDEVVPYVALAHSEFALRQLDFTVKTHTSPGLGHGIDAPAVQAAAAFIAAAI